MAIEDAATEVGIDGLAELRRRLVHLSGALLVVPYLLALVPWSTVAAFCVAGTALAVVLEALRLSGRVDWRVFDELTREYEADNPAGYALYAVGVTTVALALGPWTATGTPTPLAVPAILMLAIGDPISGVLGSADASGRKDAAVLGVMFLVCLAVAVPFVALPVAVAGALVATAADGLTPVVAGYVIDDNVTIPIGSGAAMWAVATLV